MPTSDGQPDGSVADGSPTDGSVTDTGSSDAPTSIDSSADVSGDGALSGDTPTDQGNTGPTVDPNCGDSQREQLETCDDGNRQDGDGCSANCDLELGWLCQDTADLYVPLENIAVDNRSGEQTFTFNLTELPERDVVVSLGSNGGLWVNDVAPLVDNDVQGYGLIVRLPKEAFRIGANTLRIDAYSVGRFRLAHQSVCSPLGEQGAAALSSPQITWGGVTESCASSAPIEFNWPEVPPATQSVRFEVRDITNVHALLYQSLYPLSPEQRSITFGGNVPRHDMPGCFGIGRHALEFRVVAYDGPFGGSELQVLRLIAYSDARPVEDSAPATRRVASQIVNAVDVAAPQRSDIYVTYLDITGDGRADRILTGTGMDHWKVDRNIDGAFAGVQESWTIPRSSGSPPMLLRLIDMDGDGRLDLVSLPNSVAFSALRVFRNTGHGFEPARRFQVPSEFMRSPIELVGGLDVRQSAPIRSPITYVSSFANVIDLNGDRVADLCIRQGTSLRVWFGNGHGWPEDPVIWSVPTGHWFWFDLNGDDVQELVSGPLGQPNMLIRWGTGSGYQNTDSILNGDPRALNNRLDDPNSPVTVSWSMVDINGDGNLDMVNVGQSRPGAPFPEETGGNFTVWGFNTGNFHYRVYLGNGGSFATNHIEWRVPQNFYLTTGRIHQSGTGPGIETTEGCASWVFTDIDGDGPRDVLCTMHFQRVQDRRTMGWYWGRVPVDAGARYRLYLSR